jgi:hypothetical protein
MRRTNRHLSGKFAITYGHDWFSIISGAAFHTPYNWMCSKTSRLYTSNLPLDLYAQVRRDNQDIWIVALLHVVSGPPLNEKWHMRMASTLRCHKVSRLRGRSEQPQFKS